MNNEDNEGAKAADWIVADKQQQELKSYLERGRSLKALDDESLGKAFLSEMDTWAASTPPWPLPVLLHDITAEASLRPTLELPDASKQFAVVSKHVKDVLEGKAGNLDPDSFDEDIARYLVEKERRN